MQIYTDASYSPKYKLAVCGYKHDDNYEIFTLEDTKINIAEISTINYVLRKFAGKDIIIYTDCQRVIKLLEKKDEKKEIYKIFYSLYDKFEGKCKIVKVPGHKPFSERTTEEENFSKLDKYLRSILREKIKNELEQSVN